MTDALTPDMEAIERAAEALDLEPKPWTASDVAYAADTQDDIAEAIAVVLNALPELLAQAKLAAALHEQLDENTWTIGRIKRESIYEDD
jgi:hypothetical protein